MSDVNDRAAPEPGRPEARYEVTLQPGASAPSLDAVADLDLDRVPDPQGGLRLVVTREELDRLAAAGYQVQVQEELAVRPLDPDLVLDEDAARSWLDEQLAGLEDREG